MSKIIKSLLAGAMAFTMVGCSDKTSKNSTAFDFETDFLVVGAGASGLSAAVEASKDGVENIMVIDKQGVIGGSANVAKGYLAGFETKHQKEHGLESSTYEEMYDNLMGNVDYQLDPELTAITVGNCGKTVDWLQDNLGIKFEDEVKVGYGPLEMMHVIDGGGFAMRDPFAKALEDAKVDVKLKTKATKILTDENGKAIGIEAVQEDGKTIKIGAKATLISTGGYSANQELAARLDPMYEDVFAVGFHTAMGEGLEMAADVGACISNTDLTMNMLMDYEVIKPGLPNYIVAFAWRFIQPDNVIFVGKDGKRFMDEKDAGYLSQGLNKPILNQMHKDGNPYVWVVLDEASIKEKDLKRANDFEFVTGDSIEELATNMGVDPSGLENTISTFNSYVDDGFDPEFKRTSEEGLAKLEGKLYALSIVPCITLTYGGIKRNKDAQVLRTDGTTIEGLYTAGEVSSSSAFMGFTLSNSLTWGRIAGQSAAEYINSK